MNEPLMSDDEFLEVDPGHFDAPDVEVLEESEEV
jgi:hypothetical protein